MPMSRGRVRIEAGQKMIRVYLGGEVVADTTHPKLVWEKPYYPTYYFPEGDVRVDSLVPTGHKKRSPSRGSAEVFDVKSTRRTAEQGGRARLVTSSRKCVVPNDPLPPLRPRTGRPQMRPLTGWGDADSLCEPVGRLFRRKGLDRPRPESDATRCRQTQGHGIGRALGAARDASRR
ncbi:MAG: DUF427 domain-containing protein [Acidimicrobiia bacterium]